ncbi:hypothetical protein KA047_01265 [Candidatus Saccharibacteria bacterium]|nr:hypothetical protein [Candidatus Saccharibacteria bacterium]
MAYQPPAEVDSKAFWSSRHESWGSKKPGPGAVAETAPVVGDLAVAHGESEQSQIANQEMEVVTYESD